MLNKKKRKLVWCTFGVNTGGLGWCMGEREGRKITTRGGITKKIKYIRCPECNRRLLPQVRQCQDHNCWHWNIPPHKRYIKV